MENNIKNANDQINEVLKLMTSWGMMDSLSENEKETIKFELEQIKMVAKCDSLQLLVNDLNK